jgi:hypothetical protein
MRYFLLVFNILFVTVIVIGQTITISSSPKIVPNHTTLQLIAADSIPPDSTRYVSRLRGANLPTQPATQLIQPGWHVLKRL